MIAGEPGRSVAAQWRGHGRIEQQTAALHDSGEADRALPSPAQPPQDAGVGGRGQREHQISPWLRDCPYDTQGAAEQNNEEDDLPKESDPGLKECAFLLAALAGR